MHLTLTHTYFLLLHAAFSQCVVYGMKPTLIHSNVNAIDALDDFPRGKKEMYVYVYEFVLKHIDIS